jgi:mevalonate kinase
MNSIKIQTTGKWILAGEHSVLRGCPALVFPLSSKKLLLNYQSEDQPLQLLKAGTYGHELELLFWGVLEKATAMAQLSRDHLRGTIEIQNEIPIGAGLGASAALCVAVTQWFTALKLIEPKQEYEFARQLENLFHGESSGVDIAIALHQKPIKFFRGGDRSQIKMNWQPHFYLTYSGKRGVTADCVQQVKDLGRQNPSLAEKIDHDMRTAVMMAEEALSADPQMGFAKLVAAMELAQSCFVSWGLVDTTTSKVISQLRQQGAQAVKVTGSGNGGYVLSLWQQPPPKDLDLLSVF